MAVIDVSLKEMSINNYYLLRRKQTLVEIKAINGGVKITISPASPIFSARGENNDFLIFSPRGENNDFLIFSPRGLGPTVSELDVSQHKVFPKTCFSMIIPDVAAELEKHGDIKSIVLCGIEAHACVQQTVFDLIEKDYDVHVIVDACSSRSMVDRMFAYQRMKEVGAHLTTSESILLGLLKDASHPKFKQVQKFIMESAPDSGLLGSGHEGTPV
ncbi:isochorismatase domain-containing protein 2 [Plakobranchus ocellatus]|uniref:Isochorismatase domain-containing protein 2 n=1 Tax=Plakobranchus ocellatus TaxID=259542 RepID=A0AAV4D6I9_9GAST|nr:isochorismatase domain-containing protein 2 [Plakobranchus ocellatus]